jgi:AsmA protein
MPAVRLPPLHDVTFSAKIADQGQPLPAISSLTLHAGAADLNTMYPGLNLTSLDVTAAAADQPGKASATVRVGDTPISLDATFGAPALLMPQTKAAGTFPLDVTVHAAGATVSAKGQIAQVSNWR